MSPTLPRVLLAADADVHAVAARSGKPYHLLEEGRRQGLLEGGLSLAADPTGRLRRWRWQLTRLLTRAEWGGYHLGVPLLEARWRPAQALIAGTTLINLFQLYAPSVAARADLRRWFLLDQSLGQYLDGYGLRSRVGRRLAREALQREREGYAAAEGVVVHSHWAARSVIDAGGADPRRVHVIPAGANLEPRSYADWERAVESAGGPGPSPNGTLRLVFVGDDALRKGLDRLLAAFALARRRGADATLTVIGAGPERVPADLRAVPGVRWLGRIDKAREADRFLREVAAHDVGCLLSRAEAAGLVLREFQALGLAVLGPAVGGSPEQALPEASEWVARDEDVQTVSDRLCALARAPDLVERRRRAAWAHRHEFLWPLAVERLAAALRGGA